MTFFLTNWFYQLLQFLYRLFNYSYLPTILVVTLLLRLIQIFPDIKNRKTQIKMQTVQPLINELQKKFANDPAKLRQEQSKLMKEHGVSTWSSCLPMLLILPFFFCFLSAFRCWGNEESIMLMYKTVVAQTAEEGETKTAAEKDAQETFEHFKFLWVHNIWQPDCLIDSGEGGFLFRFDADVITKPTALKSLSSKNLANMPIFKTGYTDSNGKFYEAGEIWDALVAAGLASGELGAAGEGGGGCASCSADRSGMLLLPDTVSAEAAAKMMGVEATPAADETEATPEATAAPEATEAADNAEEGSAVSGTDIYKSIMQRYPDSISSSGKPANGYLILPVLAAVMQLLTMLISNKRNKQQSEQAKQMNAMMYVMPVISILVCMSSTTAFAFYWTISGAIQLVSTVIINAVFDKKKKQEEVTEEN